MSTHYRLAFGDITMGLTIDQRRYRTFYEAQADLRADDIGTVIAVKPVDNPGAVHEPAIEYLVAAGGLALGVVWYGPFGNPDRAERFGASLGVQFQVVAAEAGR